MNPHSRLADGGRSEMVTTLVCAAAVAAQFIAGKATRDALYLANLDVTSLPAVTVLSAAVSIALAVLSSKRLGRVPPATWVPSAFILSSILLVGDVALLRSAPHATAVLVYLHISGLGPMLGSGFWLLVSERFDPRTAKRRFGQIAAAGTVGGLVGGVVAERVGATCGLAAMLPVLAALSVLCAWHTRRLARTIPALADASAFSESPETAGEKAPSGFRVLAGAPYLQRLAALVLVGAVAAALIDYAFKAEAVATLGHGEAMLRFFGAYYAVTSVITFALQTLCVRFVLERLGLAAAAGAASVALAAGGFTALLLPGFGAVAVIRASESVLRASFFRSGYELFYTPIPQAERRAAKSLIDVGVDRLGDTIGAGIVQIVLIAMPAMASGVILTATVACSLLALVAAGSLNRAYVTALRQSLLNKAGALQRSDVDNLTSRTILPETLTGGTVGGQIEDPRAPASTALHNDAYRFAEPEVRDILVMRSQDRERIIARLRRDGGLHSSLVSHVVPLLAWDSVAQDAIRALRNVAEEHVGQLTDALIDPNQPFAVRRRLARVLSACASQRACDGLLLGLDDLRFEVRFQAGRSLAALRDKNGEVHLDRDRVFALVLREVTVSRSVWESHRLLDRLDDHEHWSRADEFARDRTSRGLAHVFTLLSLVLPAEPLLIAYRSLQTSNPGLKGTALEYLQGVLPPAISVRIWPFLDDEYPQPAELRGRDEIVADLVRAHPLSLGTLA